MLPDAAMPVPYGKPRATERMSRWRRSLQAWALRRSAAYVFHLDDLAAPGFNDDVRLPEGYSFRTVRWDDLESCVATSGTTIEEYQRRWQHGGQCYAAFWEGCAAHSGWLHFGSVYVRGLGFLVEADSSGCYLYNVATAPEHRRRGLYKATQRRVTAMLRAQGVRQVTQVVMAPNRIPQIVLPQLGYRLAQSVRHTSLCGWKMTSVRDSVGKVISQSIFRRAPESVFLI